MRNNLLLAISATATVLSLSLKAEAAQIKEVEFESNNQTLVGNLYLPDDYQAGTKLPATVITGAWTTVKEQMPANYAEAMADRGYAALVFDFRNWGESSGDNRQFENPANKTEDIVAAAGYLATREEVDANKIAGLGICASSGYMADAAVQSEDLKSVALVAPWLHDRELVNEIYGGEESVRALVETSREAEAQYEATGEVSTVPAASNTNENAVMYQAEYYTDPERGAIPEYVNEFNLASWEGWLTYDSVAIADNLSDPVLIVHSEEAAIPQGAKEFYSRVPGEKEQLWLENTTQFDFYDNPEAIAVASEAVSEYFQQTL